MLPATILFIVTFVVLAFGLYPYNPYLGGFAIFVWALCVLVFVRNNKGGTSPLEENDVLRLQLPVHFEYGGDVLKAPLILKAEGPDAQQTMERFNSQEFWRAVIQSSLKGEEYGDALQIEHAVKAAIEMIVKPYNDTIERNANKSTITVEFPKPTGQTKSVIQLVTATPQGQASSI